MQHVIIFYSVLQICWWKWLSDEGSIIFRLRGCNCTWVRFPPASPRCPLWASVSQTAAPPAVAGGTTRGEPPSAQHWDCCSLQGRARRTQRKHGKTDRGLWSSGCAGLLHTSVSFKHLGLLCAHLSTPHCSTAQWWLTAAGKVWLPSLRLSSPQPHHCRTVLQPWLKNRQRPTHSCFYKHSENMNWRFNCWLYRFNRDSIRLWGNGLLKLRSEVNSQNTLNEFNLCWSGKIH